MAKFKGELLWVQQDHSLMNKNTSTKIKDGERYRDQNYFSTIIIIEDKQSGQTNQENELGEAREK